MSDDEHEEFCGEENLTPEIVAEADLVVWRQNGDPQNPVDVRDLKESDIYPIIKSPRDRKSVV